MLIRRYCLFSQASAMFQSVSQLRMTQHFAACWGELISGICSGYAPVLSAVTLATSIINGSVVFTSLDLFPVFSSFCQVLYIPSCSFLRPNLMADMPCRSHALTTDKRSRVGVGESGSLLGNMHYMIPACLTVHTTVGSILILPLQQYHLSLAMFSFVYNPLAVSQ